MLPFYFWRDYMSATAFQRRRRELAKLKEQQEKQTQVEETPLLEDLSNEEIEKFTKDEIKNRLKELEIEFKSSDSKEVLISKLKGESVNDESEKTEVTEEADSSESVEEVKE